MRFTSRLFVPVVCAILFLSLPGFAVYPRVLLQTNYGDITVELYNDKAPITVENFLQYVRIGFYDYLIFHRVVPEFMIQGGGFYVDSSLYPYSVWTNPPIINESYNGLKNLRGTVAMARTNEPNSATSQFFINLVDNPFLDRQSSINVGYCVFGNVTSGINVVDNIALVNTVMSPIIANEKSYPYPAAVGIISAKLLTPGYWLNADINNDGIADLRDYTYFATNWKKTGSNLWGDLTQNNIVDMRDMSSFSQGWLHKTNWYTIDGDINNDKIVNFADYSKICDNWQKEGKRIPGDLNNDWTVDYLDLLFLAEHWLDRLQ